MNNELEEYGARIESGHDLLIEQVTRAAELLVSESTPIASKSSFLVKLAAKGETDAEFSAFVSAFREFARDPKLDEFSQRAIDLCGTGGDRSGSFNISTFVSFIVAAGGVPVIKHGNRSISSKCGSADLLEALGIPLETDTEKLKSSLGRLNFCFLFAPFFHPAFKHLAPTRKALAEQGVVTIFNRLGPCLNPASPAYQLLGVYDASYLSQIAHTLQSNGGKRGWTVHGTIDGDAAGRMDELTACGINLVTPYGMPDFPRPSSLSPRSWGQSLHPFDDLRGGNLHHNLSIVDSLLKGESPPGLRASVLINAASAFRIAGKVQSLEEGIAWSEELIENGSVGQWLKKAQEFFLQ